MGSLEKHLPHIVEMQNRIENDFTYHPPFGDQVQRYARLRDEAKTLALLILELTPSSREQSLALTNLEQSVFFANAAIARNERPQLPADTNTLYAIQLTSVKRK